MRSTGKAIMSKKHVYFDTSWPHVDVIAMKGQYAHKFNF